MESIKELRRLLQDEKVHPVGWSRPWGYKLFQRGPSIYITRILLGTNILPNHVTMAAIGLGLLGSYFLIWFEWYFKLLGVFILYLSLIADKVDGEVARYKKKFSLSGVYLDEIYHILVPPIFWFSLAFGITKIPIWDFRYLLGAAFMGAWSLAVIRTAHGLGAQIYGKKYIKYPDRFALNHKKSIKEVGARAAKFRVVRFIIQTLHQFQDFFVILATTAIVILSEAAGRPDAIFHPYLVMYILVMGILFVLFAIEIIFKKAHGVEQEIAAIDALAHQDQKGRQDT